MYVYYIGVKGHVKVLPHRAGWRKRTGLNPGAESVHTEPRPADGDNPAAWDHNIYNSLYTGQIIVYREHSREQSAGNQKTTSSSLTEKLLIFTALPWNE